jgi:Fe-S-cluster-containing hydrogenase component 2
MKRIKIDPTKCTGCRHCEMACSINHYEHTFNSRNARIRVVKEGNLYFPVIGGPFTLGSCIAEGRVILNGQGYDICVLCRASCPMRSLFKEPGTEKPLKCDFCGEPPNPSCVKWCNSGALELVEEQEFLYDKGN